MNYRYAINNRVEKPQLAAELWRPTGEGYAKTLDCVRCLASRMTAGEAVQITAAGIESCTGLTTAKAHRHLGRMADRNILERQSIPEGPKGINQRRAPSTMFVPTAEGMELLMQEPPPVSCPLLDAELDPFARFTTGQRQTADCTRCIFARQPNADNPRANAVQIEQIVRCNKDTIPYNTVRNSLDLFARDGWCIKTQSDTSSAKGGPRPKLYLPVDGDTPLTPLANPDCPLSTTQLLELVPKLTKDRMRALGCLACLVSQRENDKTVTISRSTIEACTGLDYSIIRTLVDRLTEDNYLFKQMTTTGYRTAIYTPTDAGLELLRLVNLPAECTINREELVRRLGWLLTPHLPLTQLLELHGELATAQLGTLLQLKAAVEEHVTQADVSHRFIGRWLRAQAGTTK